MGAPFKPNPHLLSSRRFDNPWSMPANADTLTEINLDELVASFGWQDRPLLRRPLRRLFLGPAQAFARHMLEFDARWNGKSWQLLFSAMPADAERTAEDLQAVS